MSHITIEWLSDKHDCETCGYNYAIGARISVDGKVALELEPVASCFGGGNWSEEEVYQAILRDVLGHTVEEA